MRLVSVNKLSDLPMSEHFKKEEVVELLGKIVRQRQSGVLGRVAMVERVELSSPRYLVYIDFFDEYTSRGAFSKEAFFREFTLEV